MNQQHQFINPVYQPIQTPKMTMYSSVFSSQTANVSSKKIIQEPIITAMDQVIEDRTSAEFGQHSRHISLNQQVELDQKMKQAIQKSNYVACSIF